MTHTYGLKKQVGFEHPIDISRILRDVKDFPPKLIWLVVSTHLKNISQIGSFPQVGVKIKNI